MAGAPVSPDVIIASELARVGNLDLEVNHGGCLPSDDAAECRRRISLALLWEAGYRFTHRHELFLANGRQFSRGGVKISGKHGEIGRAYYAKKYGSESEAKRQEARFVERMMHGMPPFTRRRWRGAVREIIAEAYEQADHYGLTGLARQDFFYLNERTRRLASGSHSAKTGFVFAPFLNPDYLRACFAYPSYEKTAFPFHRHIVSTNTPEWTSVPYAGGSEAHELSRSRSEALKAPETEDEGKSGWRRATGEGNYDSALYWKTTARPIIDECLRDDGFWTELFDPDLVRDRWEAAPQELAITYLLPHVLEEATVP
ncbi:MAG: hypothetical protein GWN99_04725 [Gemmatimonadetes bacterium]|uniref:Uncharacterized protein n=1 Tax=Candidatus Kutchimonas denitrificans TaxID=3056748 RepID=A0AAE4Z8G6_9BACT|nr:hypothetical protein [Gemmatimonadota bacterium]NIR75755.1 hypothetical protein [Candidatus Kutchimonas denitrificans]NIS00368.1 hypothetical protein [Gemmatimonadota bacterium]NIT66027.1 hypothetical protein [Gemmatimonadota bacterium]NIU53731.1 hypothetical protein [Gemmatimonadota bacterium]